MDNKVESIQFDCNRGCTVQKDDESGELNCTYREGCCKLKDHDWLHGISQPEFNDIFEVRFKNTRKGFYINASGQNVKLGDLVVVEAATGHDLGIVTLEGPVVGKQMQCKGIDPTKSEFKKIYRKARAYDIEKWQEAIAREQDTMIKARRIAAELGLEMKIGDVEFQGDGTKAIFYYIADGRVDFRQLIKVYAEEFRIRIEMKQIGARQEAGLIGGLGICGRELCCANYVTNFQSISTSAARVQDLSLNPQKLAGQCGKLKCCLNYEVATYMDAQSRLPRVTEPLQFEDGPAYLVKTDILKELMYFSYDKHSLSEIYPLDAEEVQNVLDMNADGIRPESLKLEPEPVKPEFITAVGDDSITRFDNTDRRKKRRRPGKGGNGGNGGRGGAQNGADRGTREASQDGGPQNDAPQSDSQAPKNQGNGNNRGQGGRGRNDRRRDGRRDGKGDGRGENRGEGRGDRGEGRGQNRGDGNGDRGPKQPRQNESKPAAEAPKQSE